MSEYLDSDIEFAFIRMKEENIAGSGSNVLVDPIDCLSFYC